MCHYFGYFSGLLPEFWIPFWAIPAFLGIIFLVKFDFFKNNSDVLVLIFILMTLWNVACRALVSCFLWSDLTYSCRKEWNRIECLSNDSTVLQFSFLFYYACAKSSIFSLIAISLSWYISVVLSDFNIILPLWIIFNVLRSSQMNKVN